MQRKKLLSLILLIIAVSLMVFVSACVKSNYIQTDEKLTTRENVTINIEIYEPQKMQPKGIIVMLPGGNGTIDGTNFVVRQADQFVEQGYIAVIMGPPSFGGMNPLFRYTPKHHNDIKKVIEYMADKYKQKPLYLLAFSASNLSVSSFVSAKKNIIKNDPVTGIILMSGLWQALIDEGVLYKVSKIPYPALIVHHENDGCGYCLFEGTKKYYDLLEAKGRKDLLVVQGGTLTSRMGDACGPYHYHAFEGLEDKVTKIVVNWMDGKEIPKLVKMTTMMD